MSKDADRARSWVGWSLVLLALLWWPVDWSLAAMGAGELRAAQLVGTVAAALALAAVAALLPRRMALAVMVGGLLVSAVVRAGFFGLVRFSGSGYTSDVFVHLELESLRVAWMEYPLLIVAALPALALVALAASQLGQRMVRMQRRTALMVMVPALIAAGLSRDALPEVSLATTAWRWYGADPPSISVERVERWQESGLVETDLVEKSELVATAAAQPRNLVLLYLESVGLAVMQHPDYPGLMPYLEQLQREHALVDHLHASSYITIEGIVNTQCGTLFPFRSGSDSLASADGLAEAMPCLGDVLAAAGYQQSYLGGAGLGFAGKGAFLGAHGYDRRVGLDEWRERGLDQRPGSWGLSDADLFEQATGELRRLQEDGRPFNLTLLTIGTHLPGYVYEECRPYRDDPSERFVDALACTDQLVQQWLESLREAGLLRDTLVVITADHHVFPNPEMRELFGDEAVLDRRLPLIVLGGADGEFAKHGAGYDLAPTVLDLLGVKHNARFALGRNLRNASAERNYFVARYEDHSDSGVTGTATAECAAADSNPELPLDPCERDELLDLLAVQLEAHSRPRPRIDCSSIGANRMMVPEDAEQGFELRVGGIDQSQRFLYQSRPVPHQRDGAFLAAFNREGTLLERHYLPLCGEAGGCKSMAPELPEGHVWALVWRNTAGAKPVLPDWLPSWLVEERATALLLKPGEGAVIRKAFVDDEGRHRLNLDGRACRKFFEAMEAL